MLALDYRFCFGSSKIATIYTFILPSLEPLYADTQVLR